MQRRCRPIRLRQQRLIDSCCVACLAIAAAAIRRLKRLFRHTKDAGFVPSRIYPSIVLTGRLAPVSNVISMDRRIDKGLSQKAGVRDRRYAIRYPFAADAELIDLETGTQANGVTCDISLGGCFICTSKPLPLQARARMTLSRKGQRVEGLAVVRIVKPRIGMGVEFIDVESTSQETLSRWIEQLRQK